MLQTYCIIYPIADTNTKFNTRPQFRYVVAASYSSVTAASGPSVGNCAGTEVIIHSLLTFNGFSGVENMSLKD